MKQLQNFLQNIIILIHGNYQDFQFRLSENDIFIKKIISRARYLTTRQPSEKSILKISWSVLEIRITLASTWNLPKLLFPCKSGTAAEKLNNITCFSSPVWLTRVNDANTLTSFLLIYLSRRVKDVVHSCRK